MQDRKTESEAWHASLKVVFSGHGPQTGTQVSYPQPILDTSGPLHRVYHTSKRVVWWAAWRQWLDQEALWRVPHARFFYLSFPWTNLQH